MNQTQILYIPVPDDPKERIKDSAVQVSAEEIMRLGYTACGFVELTGALDTKFTVWIWKKNL